MIVYKRDGRAVVYDENKIIKAIQKANKEVEDLQERATMLEIKSLLSVIESTYRSKTTKDKEGISVEEIQDLIEQYFVKLGKYNLAKKYILYRYKREIIRKSNTTDESILSLVRSDNKEVMEENSNKNAYINSTQRDLIAGEVSKDLSKRLLLPADVVKAHEDGVLHFHDMDYFLQHSFNCCLVNIKDMLDNGTVMNGKLIESPKSFQVACTVMTQIIAAVASGQYGGQSVNIKHLGKYLKISFDKYKKRIRAEYEKTGLIDKFENENEMEKSINISAMSRLKEELKAGVQTIQYQINTLMTTNGQSPFVTLFLHIDDNDPYEEYTAMIIEEIIDQIYEGIKNEKGVYVTPAFPKLIYVLDENNIKGGPYNYITKKAARCTARRLYPDYISAKKMRENYDNEVFSCMGCRSFLSNWKNEKGEYVWEGRFNQGVVSINLPQIGIIANGDENEFWKLLDERLELCKKALMCRRKNLLGTKSDTSPIHFQHGAIARLKPGETIDELLKGGYSTISLGYIGLYETTIAMKGVSHTTKEGHDFAIRVMKKLREKTDEWKKETGLGFGLYGSPAESLCYRFAEIDKAKFGIIENITDKGYYTNSYH